MNKEAKEKLKSKEWLKEQYLDLDKTIKQIARELSVYKATLVTRLRKYGLEKDVSLINKKRYETLQKTMTARYGANHPSKVKEIKEKREKTNLKKYGVQSTLSNPETQEKIKKTNLKKYGFENPQKNKKIREKTEKTCIKSYGFKTSLVNPKVKNKTKKTIMAKYGVDNISKSDEIKDIKRVKSLEKYGVTTPLKSEEIKSKIKKTCLKNWGVENPSQSEEIKDKVHQTKIDNGSYGKSEPEDNLHDLIYDEICGKVERQYKEDPRYPFACDFYIAESDCFIELQGDVFRHRNEPYDGENLPLSYTKKSCDSSNPKKAKNYKSSINTYTVRDPEKRLYASLYNLNFLEIWNSDLKKGWGWVDFLLQKQGLPLNYSEEVLKREFKNISKQKGDFTRSPTHNKIIEHFQPHFYRKERELWNHPLIREKLVTNREKYKFRPKEELTNKVLLQGFKISGIHTGYSFFSPLWIKSFIDKYSIKSIYDPCMGWGHRLLGAKDITYIGNDICTETFKGNRCIAKYFDMKNKVFHNQPAEDFIPKESYDAVFTCPPYFNTEIYNGESTSTSRFSSYGSWLNEWWRKVVQNCLISSPKYFSFVINNKYKEDMKQVCFQEGLSFLEEIPIGNNQKNHFQRVSKNSYKCEVLLILNT